MRTHCLKLFAISCLFAGLPVSGHCQVLPFDHYSIKNGLPSTWINSIIQDSRGYLWIGGDEGVSVYDGIGFKTYSLTEGLPVSHVWQVYESPASPGTMWIGTHGAGAVKFVQGKFTVYQLGTKPGANTAVNFLEDHTGILWCGTNAGVYQIHNDSVAFFPTGNSEFLVPFISQTRDRRIWISTDRRLYRYSHRTGQTQVLELGVAPALFTCMVEDGEGNIWLGTDQGMLYQIRDDRVVASRRMAADDLSQMIDDGEGGLWAITPAGILKVSKHDFVTGEIIWYTTANGLHENNLLCGLRDRENNFWFGGRTKGLAKLSDRDLFTFQFNDLRADVMNRAAVSDARGRFFLISPECLWEIWKPPQGNWQKHRHDLERGNLTGRLWQADFDTDSTLWIAFNDGGLCSYQIQPRGDQHSILTRTHMLRPGREIPEGFPIAFNIDRENQLWCSIQTTGFAQVAHFDLRTSTLIASYTPDDSLPLSTIRAIWRDRTDNLWIGSFAHGISMYKFSENRLHFFRKLTKTTGLSDNGIRIITERSNGEIWIGTRFGGIAIFDQGQIRTISTRDGLLSNAVWGLAEDAEGRMWIANSIGMQFLTAGPSPQMVTPKKLTGQFVGSIGVTSNHKVWGVGHNEFIVCDYARKPLASAPPLIYITGLRVNGKLRSIVTDSEFAHDENLCTLEFTGLSFKDEKAVRYQYRLSGLHDDWQEPTDQRLVTFASLRPGTYTFQVIALNSEGIKSAAPALFTFRIRPPFWRRWWFIAFCVVLLGSVLYAVHIVRVDRLLEIEKIRARIATDLHDDIGAGLTHIGLLSQVALHKKSVQQFYRNDKAHPSHEGEHDRQAAAAIHELGGAVERVGSIARELSAAMSDVVWSINPKHDSVEALQRRLKAFANEICSAKNIALSFEVSPQLAGMKLNPEIRRNLLLIAKEALHNMAKYSGSPSVEVKIGADSKALSVVIDDRGKGFDSNGAPSGNGLNNMRSRAEKLGGACEIISAPGRGTRVVANVPYKN